MTAKPDPERDKWVGRWRGETVVCMASGPSLTVADCLLVQASGRPSIVTNTTFMMAPWAEVLFAFDGAWWREYRAQVDASFAGERVTCSSAGRVMGQAQSLLYKSWFTPFQNSGASAIALAIVGAARRVVLLGYDCQMTGGKTHWHGDHPKKLSNAISMKHWPKAFKGVARFAQERGVEVVNCSRETALDCFPRCSLELALWPDRRQIARLSLVRP